YFYYFLFHDPATTELYTLSLHDALPIYWALPALERFHVRQTFTAAVSLGHLLVAVMSAAVLLTLATLWRVAFALIRNRSLSEAITDEAVLYAAGAALGIRSLFGTLWTEIPAVSPTAYTIFFV